MGTTIKVVLRKKQKENNTYPLAIRITKDRKTSFVHTGQSIREDDWDAVNERVKKSHKNAQRLNNFLLTKKAEASNYALELETLQADVSAKTVKKKIKPTAGGTVFSVADLYITRLKDDKKYNRLQAEEPRVKYLKAYLKEDIAFSDFTMPLIKRFKAWLKSERHVSERTAANYLALVRSIFSLAIEEKACDPKYYPFGKGKIGIKFPASKKIGGDISDVSAIESVNLSDNPKEHHARNIWLFSFYFAGMRVSDVFRLKWSDFQNGRLFYAMGKNNKVDSLKVPAKALAIIEQYRDEKDTTDLVFPELKGLPSLDDPYAVQVRVKTKLGPINRHLKEVAKKAKVDKIISMHISRHTFGNLSGDKIPVQMLQKLYRHSDISTTIGYQAAFINKSADDALDSVVS